MSMTIIPVTTKTVKKYRVRFYNWKDAGYPDADTEIVEILELLNKVPGVATMYSCASHPKERYFRLYIQCVATKKGAKELSNIHENLIANAVGVDLIPWGINLSITYSTTRDSLFKDALKTYVLENENLKTPKVKKLFLQCLKETLKTYLSVKHGISL